MGKVFIFEREYSYPAALEQALTHYNHVGSDSRSASIKSGGGMIEFSVEFVASAFRFSTEKEYTILHLDDTKVDESVNSVLMYFQGAKIKALNLVGNEIRLVFETVDQKFKRAYLRRQ